MPREAGLLERSLAALALWQDLRAAYDAIEEALGSPERYDLAALGSRIVALESALRSLIGELAAARSRPDETDRDVADIWQAIDDVVTSLAARQPTLVRAALAARSETAERLESMRAARGQLRRYQPAPQSAAQLTSRRA